jgi:hypothetical protein
LRRPWLSSPRHHRPHADIGDATVPAELRRIPGRRRREPDRPRALEILNTSDDVRKAEVAAIDKVYEAETRKNALLAKVLKYQKEYAQRAVRHAQKLRPPIEVVVAHYRNK